MPLFIMNNIIITIKRKDKNAKSILIKLQYKKIHNNNTCMLITIICKLYMYCFVFEKFQRGSKSEKKYYLHF